MFSTICKKTAALAIMAACVVLLQWHAWGFWTDYAGAYAGPAWAVTIELAAIWLWSRRQFLASVLALLASVTILASSLHGLSDPVLDAVRSHGANVETSTAQLASLDNRIETLKAQLETYLANSQERTGWLPAIRDTEASLAAAHEARGDLLAASSAPTAADWQTWAILILQATSLIIFQMVAVMTSRFVFAPAPAAPQNDVEPVQDAVTAEPEPAVAEPVVAAEVNPSPKTAKVVKIESAKRARPKKPVDEQQMDLLDSMAGEVEAKTSRKPRRKAVNENQMTLGI